MTVFTGKSVYSASASGFIHILKKPRLDVRRYRVESIDEELHRFDAAKYVAARQLQELYDRYISEIGETNAQIFEIHMMMLEDEDYNGSIIGMIEAESINAEYAVARTSDIFAQMLEAMDNEYMRARSADVRDVSERLITILTAASAEPDDIRENSVICADDLLPSQAASLDRRKISAFITAHGSPISHTAILIHSMNIPAVIGVGDSFLPSIRSGEPVIVDGTAGEVYLDPDVKTRTRFSKSPRAKSEDITVTRTRDGRRITLLESVGGEAAAAQGCSDGIAMLGCGLIPDEERQYGVYRSAAESTAGQRVLLRMPKIPQSPERHSVFEMQMRCVLRASACGSLAILFPAITCVTEARKILAAFDAMRSTLRAKGVEPSEDTMLGFMIETPAAAVISDELAPMADLFMIDSDSIARLSLDSDGDEIIAEEFAAGQRAAVMRMISTCARNAVKNGARIGICGSLAADTSLTEELLKLGIDIFCAPSERLSAVREAIVNTDLSAGK